jgi:hypothetical protein
LRYFSPRYLQHPEPSLLPGGFSNSLKVLGNFAIYRGIELQLAMQ